ncbi:MAG: glycosyltransferase [Chitinophagaceae bacterium]|nr:MAG: glycosyltransferase [Chitinophagaceae bacterium]
MEQLNRIPKAPPYIAPRPPVPLRDSYPLWSVMIPVYNCATYLGKTLESVLCQDPGKDKMQIEVCDDASTDDDVEKIVRDIGKGRVTYFRQSHNVGHLRNFVTCLNRSRGDWVHLLHGDDKVYPGFYNKMENLFFHFPEAGAAFCRYKVIDEYDGNSWTSDEEMDKAGILDDWLMKLACEQRIVTPSMVVKRIVYEELGGFYGVHHCEDWEMWLRIASHFKTGFVPNVLAEYLLREGSNSSQSFLKGQDIKDIHWLIKSTKKYFTEADWKKIQMKARYAYAHSAVKNANKIWDRYHHRRGVRNQLVGALRLFPGRSVLFPVIKLYFKTLF